MKTLKTLKHIALLVGLLLMSFVVAGQSTTATIGTGTSTNYYPMPGFWGYQYDVYLYTPSAADFLNNTCTISSIAWQISSGSTNSAQMTIWIKEVDASTTLNSSTTFSSFTSGATQVYSGSRTTSTGWNTYSFSSSFSHQAGKALLVMVRGVGCSSSGGCSRSCYYTSATGTHWYKHSDSSDPGTSVTGTIDGNRSNVQIKYSATPTHTLAGTIQCGQTVSGTLGTSGSIWGSGSSPYNMYSGWGVGAEAVYAFTPQMTGTHIIVFNTTSGDPDFWVLSENNPQTAIYATSGGNQSTELTVGHTYYIVADNYSSSSSAGYSIQITCPQIYTVTFNANGGSGTMNPQEFVSNVSQALTSNTFTNPGYEFAGWNRAANGSGASYSDGQSITVDSDITLYAQWNCLQPSDIQLSNISETSAQVTWNGNAEEYIVYVYKVVKYENVHSSPFDISNLEPGTNYYVRVESICGESNISDVFTTGGTPLPITLISFTGVPRSKYNHIEWTTATEKNNDYFILESSVDAVHFKEIYRTSGAGNSIEALDYDFKDYNPVADITYYRLTQVDYDGAKTTSEIIECKRTSDEKVSKRIVVYPNPAKDEMTIINAEGETIVILNSLGQVVLSLENAADNQTIDVTDLPSGTYFVKIGNTVEKVVISK